ncbi:MAG: septum formation protein Maf [Sphingomonadales bacterium]|nr:septum formation protein Maf [Sphingomonadales bacterium]MDE2168643.1 septum formation protein Maf [Sphingomonadales bacterium]
MSGPNDAASPPALVLASSSPRRRELLGRLRMAPGSQMVAPARIASPDIDETPRKGEVPRAYALRMAVEKARAVPRAPGEIILAGDTTVALGRRILDKADTPQDVRMMLGKLAGRRHRVYAGVAVIDAEGREKSRMSETIVTFKNLSDAEIEAYVASGEGLGKAGGYAIQGLAEALIRALSGSHSGVIGLPLYETRALLRWAGLPLD